MSDGATAKQTFEINQLTAAFEKASTDSGRIANRIAWLTAALVIVGAAQVIAAVWQR